MNRKGILSIGMLALLLPLLSVNVTQVTGATAVEVGLLTPQTGGLSAYSRGFEHAADLAITHLNAMTEFADYTFALTKYDTQTEPTASTTAMTQAVTDGMDYIVGAAGSSNTLAAAALAKSEGVPMISYASTSPELTTFNDGGYLWRTPPSDALQGRVISDLAKTGNMTEMVIVTLDNAYGSGLATATKSAFETGDFPGSVLKTITYSETNLDFTTIVNQIIAEAPDVVVAIAYATDGSLLFVEMDLQGVDALVIGADGVADVGIFSESTGTAAAMAGFLMTKPTALDTTAGTDFTTAYKAAYSNTTGDIYTGETYDAVMAGAWAVLDAGSTDGAAIIASLATISFDGATGPMSFDDNGDSTAGFYQISEVSGTSMDKVGSWTALGRVEFSDVAYGTAFVVNELPTGSAADTSSSDDSPFNFLAFFVAISAAVLISRKRKF